MGFTILPVQEPKTLALDLLLHAYETMYTAASMAHLYEEKREVCSKYVHATSRGHEAIQVALGMQLLPQDFVAPYYRDDALLLAIGMEPYELMLQLLAKAADPFSGGRTYYAHPSLRDPGKPKIIHQSSATGMQAIPATGVAQGLKYRALQGLDTYDTPPISVCSLGDGAMTEGEIAEALQMAALHQYPILYLVQDNGWGISASGEEMYAQDAVHYAKGFRGIETREVDGADFIACYETLKEVLETLRKEQRPFLVQARVPLLNHHTSGVRKEWYRHDLEKHQTLDPILRLYKVLQQNGISESQISKIHRQVEETVREDFEQAVFSPDPDPATLYDHVYAESTIQEESGERSPKAAQEILMVDAALHAIDALLEQHPEALLYGQDVGGRLGGVFREAATLAQKHGKDRVFNTPIQEAYIIGSTAGLSATGCKPIVEIQFADYIFPGINQLYSELSRSCYLSQGKWPVSAVIRVPIGAYGSGGPYHSSSVESIVLSIKGVKVVYPSNAADMKGLLRAAFYDPNPVIIFEHKGLYWSKVPGTREAKCPEPSDDYIIPLGKARIYQEAQAVKIHNGESCVVITYGMGVHWARQASVHFPGAIEILDLRSLEPLDWDTICLSVKRHNKVLVLTEETLQNSFASALAGRISFECFQYLDAPVHMLGAENLPAIPLNACLEAAMLPNADKVQAKLTQLLRY